ncbi:hypothetical protein [Saccharothrix sp. HUAS TT1]|uniref:hypothetical protein n=1 Tax=unclassified Saccharothrix TaxID=2593673 RepID=UPI00345B508D
MTHLIDTVLPAWEHREHHARRVAAPPERVWAALVDLRVSDLPLTMALVRLRGGPVAWLRGVQAPPDTRALTSFAPKPVLDDPPHEIVLADVARYTRLAPGRPDLPRGDGAAFTAFDEPGWTKVVMNFRLDPDGEHGTLLSTETRVHSTDATTRLAFRPYWLLVRFGSGLIRRDLLAATARTAV